jgi:hypothetical protein
MPTQSQLFTCLEKRSLIHISISTHKRLKGPQNLASSLTHGNDDPLPKRKLLQDK